MRLLSARRSVRTGATMRRWSTVVLALSVTAACSTLQWRPDSKATAPVIDGFGAEAMQPSRANAAARRLFAQGMAQVYAFNEIEAIRSFKAALAQDPDCALCAWGVAYQMGPNINDTDRHDLREAIHYVDYAVKHSAGSPERERALIDALALRYGTAPGARATAVMQADICGASGTKRADPLDIAYAGRVRELVARFPGDPDILSIYAEAELVATREDWWDRVTGKPAGRVGELADMLEQGLARHPQHIGLIHYMIHTVDAVPVARRAEAAADRLGALAPRSPHLLHMPSHTYAHLGRYADATRVNQAAVAADEVMEAELKRQNFSVSKDWRGHNLHFQWHAALMEGRGDLALATARTLALRGKGDNTYHEYLRSLPMLTLLRLQRWDALRQEPLPSGDKGVATVMGQMASGIALAHAGQRSAAQAALARLDPAADQLVKENPGEGYVNKLMRSMARTAQAQWRAEIAWYGEQVDEALTQQQLAVTASSDAEATEPPTLAAGPRLRLGAMQLAARRYAAAEQSFREHLAEHPGNDWALQGLRQALSAQGKQAEAKATESELERNWKQADSGLRSAAR
ncbi:hypothetical protein SRABI118_01577 [Massilia sp. Bi118]|uniref:hypothetical protein n=1 Tax=Massilia sp. Bi118 TaxID=2822346 RepID=UPI001D341810|nr:hypothetical protein [Massilia sp. Bi118]CAH0194280.1 hypothetical protein SRABI118_01577 [Massilia sp. Bi118]